jgi:VWFA-related protein
MVEEVRVELVQFNILATDRRGDAITDLKPADIEVRDNGSKQVISFVEAYVPTIVPPATIAAAPDAAAAPAKPAPPVVETPGSPASQAPPQSTRGRWIVLFFDNVNSSQRTRFKSRDAARSFVEGELSPDDWVAVVCFTGKTEILQSFTRSKGKVLDAISAVGARMDIAVEDRAGALDDLVSMMENCKNNSAAVACVHKYAASWADGNVRSASGLLTALTTVARGLAAIPAIKVVAVFSEGIARDAAAEARDAATLALGELAAQQIMVSADSMLTERAWNRLVEAAAASRVSIFPINPGGALGRFGEISARRGAPLDERTNKLQVNVYKRSAENLNSGLVEIAQRTGGEVLRTADPLMGLRAVVKVSAGLYTVGFQPRGAAIGGPHEIKIKALRRGVHLQFAREVPRTIQNAALRGSVDVQRGACSEEGRRGLGVVLELDRTKLSFEEVDKILSCNFSLFTSIFVQGATEPTYIDYRIFNITHKPEEVAAVQQNPRVEQTFVVPCKPMTITLTATDAASGAKATFSQVVD